VVTDKPSENRDERGTSPLGEMIAPLEEGPVTPARDIPPAAEPPEPHTFVSEGDTLEVSEPAGSGAVSSKPSDSSDMDEIIASLVGEQDDLSIEISALEGTSVEPRQEVSQPDQPEEKKVPQVFSRDSLDALLAEIPVSEVTQESKESLLQESPVGSLAEAAQSETGELSEHLPGGVVVQRTPAPQDAADQAEPGFVLEQIDKSFAEQGDGPGARAGDEWESLVDGFRPETETPSDVATAPGAVGQTVPLVTEEELNRVLAGEDSEQPLDHQTLDAVLPEARGGATGDMDMPLAASSEQPAETLTPPSVEEDIAQPRELSAVPWADAGKVDEGGDDVGSENLAAAGTVQQRPDTDEAAQAAINALLNRPASPPEKAAPEKVKEAGIVPESGPAALPVPETRRRTRLRVLPRVPPSLLAKAGLSVAAGLLFGVTAYVLLSNYQTQVPDLEVPDVSKTHGLQQTIENANGLMKSGDYAGARRVLEGPAREAPPSPLRTQVELMRIEAAYRSLGPNATQFDIELVNSYIDTFLANSHTHPEAPKVLQWKADLYERVGIPLAAYDIYAQILSDYQALPDKPALLLRAGRLALGAERYQKAAEHLEQLVREYPEAKQAAEGKILLGEALARLGRQDEGEALLIQVAEANKHTVWGAQACAALGRMALDRGDYPAAIELLRRRLQSGTTSEGNDNILLMLAGAYRATNQMQEAQDALRDIIRFFPESGSASQAYIELTEVLDLLGRRDDALRIASEAAHEHPKDPKVLLQYARMRELAGDSRGAAEVLLGAEETSLSTPESLLMAGNQFLKAGYPGDARDAFERLASKFPGTPQAVAGKVALARIALDNNEASRALHTLEEMAVVTANTPQETEVLLALGDMYQELGLPKRAADAYRTAASRSSDPEVLAKAAMALYAAGAWPEGNEVSQRLDIRSLTAPTAYNFLLEYGHAMLRSDSRRALELMEQAHADYAEQRTVPQTRRLLETCLALDQPAKALTLVEELSLKVEPASAEAFREIAIACGDYAIHHEDYATAAAAYEKAVEAKGQETQNVYWARLQLANALYALGKTEESRLLLQSVAASTSSWAPEAKLELDNMDFQGRLKGEQKPAAETEG